MSDAGALDGFAGKCVVMWTSYVSSPLFEVAWRKLETTLEGKRVQFEKLDGAAPDNKAARTALWALSGSRTYPQVFCDQGDGLKFVGDMDTIQELLDGGGFDAVFSKFIPSNN